MDSKKLLVFSMSFVLCLSLVSYDVNAFTLFGIDWGNVWDSISFWSDDEPVVNEVSSVKKTSSSSSSTKKSTSSKPKTETKVTLGGVEYTASQIKYSINANKDYIKGFGYDCLFIETDKGTKFSLFFNTETGEYKSLKLGEKCDRRIYLEESLLEDFSKDGFKASNIKTYLDKVDLPTSMYFKAIKVFTVG